MPILDSFLFLKPPGKRSVKVLVGVEKRLGISELDLLIKKFLYRNHQAKSSDKDESLLSIARSTEAALNPSWTKADKLYKAIFLLI